MNLKKNDVQPYRQAVIGFCAGVVITLVIFAAAKGVVFPGAGSGSGKVIAEISGEKLTEAKLQEMIGAALIPLETDRYAVYSRAVDKWISEKLFAKEAKSLGISLQDLYFKKIWDQVRVSSGDVAEYYNNNKELFNQPLEKIREPLLKQLREKEYGRVEQKYLEELKTKYRAKILLEKPKYYAGDLAVIPQPGAPMPTPGAPTAAPQPTMPPPPAKISFSPEDLKGQYSKGPENAPVTIMEFSDFHCPFCGRVNPTLDQLLKAYPDKVRLVWFHYPLPFHQGADQTAAASECAGDQGKFWDYHGKLFEKTGQFKDDAALIGLAKELGLNEGKFKECLTSGKYKEKVKNNALKGQAWGVNGTPAFFINGVLLSGAQPYESFKNAVENALNPGSAPMPTAPMPPQAPPQPKFVNFSESDLAGKPTSGSKDAPVTIVEFSDFHCPFCGRGSQTMDQVEKNYPGKIRRIFRHFPLPFHQGADQTHAASECANDQGKFWEYHGKLFEKTGQFKDDDSLISLAKELNLDEKKFTQCLKEGKYKEKVKSEVAAGQTAGVNGTPTFFINGELVSGAMPYETFSKMVDNKLAQKK